MSITISEPYRCTNELGDDDLAGFGLPMVCLPDGPQWWQLGLQLAWSCVVWVLVYFCSRIAETRWRNMIQREGRGNCPPAWVQKWVGTDFRNPKDQRLEIFLECAQWMASSTNIFLWIKKTYFLRGSTDVEFAIELMCVVLNICHAIFGHIRAGFRADYCFEVPVLIDSLTISPIILQRADSLVFGGSWLTLAYLRAYQQLTAFKHLCTLGMFEQALSDFTQAAIITGLECVLVVYTIAGTIWVLEGLGDITGFTDRFMPAGMGGISFFQSIYFAFMTISTVGFGDYSPTTVLSRAFTILATIAGVTYFSMASVQILELKKIEDSGLGRFRPSKKAKYQGGRGHILVMGGGVACGSPMVLETFLRALCRGDNTPEIVLMSEAPCSDPVRQLLRQEWTRNFKIHYFVGAPLDRHDMERVRASQCSQIFVIADFQTADSPTEDRSNLMYAMHVQRTYPNTESRIMLNGMSSESLGTQIGLHVVSAYSIEALKASMLATSLLCPGFSTLVLNLGLPDLPDPNHTYGSFGWNETRSTGGRLSATGGEGDVSPWLTEYVTGVGLEPYGFLPAAEYVGMTFTEASVAIAEENLLLLAAQIDGAIRINPGTTILRKDTVLFALANDSGDCDRVAKGGDANVATWIDTFDGHYHRGGFKVRQRRKSTTHVSNSEPASAGSRWTQIRRAISAHHHLDPHSSVQQQQQQQQNSAAHHNAGVDLDRSPVVERRFMDLGASPRPTGFDASTERTPLPPGAEDGLFPPNFPLTPRSRSATAFLNASKDKTSTLSASSDFMSLSAYAGAGGTPDTPPPLSSEEKVTEPHKSGGPGSDGAAAAAAGSSSGGGGEDSDGLTSGRAPLRRSSLDNRGRGSEVGFVPVSPLDRNASNGVRGHHRLTEIVALGERVDEIAAAGGHTVIVLFEGKQAEAANETLWQQLDLIVDVLRSTWGSAMPVIVVNSRACKRYELKLLEEAKACGAGIGFITGDPLDPAILVAAGVPDCCRLMTLVPSSPPSVQGQDVGNLMLVMLLEQLVFKGRHDDVPSVFDWYSPRSVALLPAPPAPPLSLQSLQSVGSSVSEYKSQDSTPPVHSPLTPQLSSKQLSHQESLIELPNMKEYVMKDSFVSGGANSRRASKPHENNLLAGDGGLRPGDVAFANREPRSHYRFAAGRVLPKPHIAAMFSMAYYTPGVLEMLESLINPAKYDQTSVAWTVEVPERHVGQDYWVVAIELLKSGAAPMGLLRAPPSDGGTPLPYVVAATPKTPLKLRPGDSVFALADRAWAASHDVVAAVEAQAAAALFESQSN